MPPGAIAIHAPLTVEDCGMTGGMFWNYAGITRTLEHMATTAQNPHITNESMAIQLQSILRALKQEVNRAPAHFKIDEQDKYDVLDAIDALQSALDCQCDCEKCNKKDCICASLKRGCTVECHPNGVNMSCIPAKTAKKGKSTYR